jgi:serine protease Do
MLYETNKRGLTFLMIMTILLSGILGFTGSYIAGKIDKTAEQPGEVPKVIYQEVIRTSSASQRIEETYTIPEITALVANSIVEITTEIVTTGGRMGQYISEGAGSGVIITSDGYIVTNNHVIEGANKITVRLKNGETYDAELMGRDSRTDLAVIRITAVDLQPAVYGDSDKLLVGETAVAIGNPLGSLGGTVTEGIISALDRDIVIDGESMNLLQTTAAINPGNSGGGLFNAYGELIGIVNAKSSGSGIEGLGFAIPINSAKEIIEQLMEYGYIPGRIDLGVTLVDIQDSVTAMMYRVQRTGVYVLKVTTENGLRKGDRIISINGKDIITASDFKSSVEEYQVGDTITITVQRSTGTLEVPVTLLQARY